jgi:hypothetical protein
VSLAIELPRKHEPKKQFTHEQSDKAEKSDKAK